MASNLLPSQQKEGITRYRRVLSQPENPFAELVPDQQIAIIPEFTLESGYVMHNVPVAYWTRGTLNAAADNAMVICHALTGSADVSDWWGPLVGGAGRAADVSRFFVVCMNSLGSPYGTASPVTYKHGDPDQGYYGPEFPLTTIRDDVNLHKLLLDDLGVKQVAAVIGGSLGGMFVLEWAYLGKEYIRTIVPIATSSRHSAWGISWGETQRQSIFGDPKYEDGYYSFDDPPATGLGAARMAALLTYRSRNSFESRFGRRIPDASKRQTVKQDTPTPTTASEAHFHIHNDGHKIKKGPLSPSKNNSEVSLATATTISHDDPQFHGPTSTGSASQPITKKLGTGADAPPNAPPTSTYFSAQSYLRYQAQKFVHRFDANCYIAMTRKIDTHDVSRPRTTHASRSTPPPTLTSPHEPVPELEAGFSKAETRPLTMAEALGQIEQPTLVLGIESDGLFTFAEQEELVEFIPNAQLGTIDSPEGHDAFLLQFEQVNRSILAFLKEYLPDIMEKASKADAEPEEEAEANVGTLTKSSVFGEAEVEDITAW